MLWPFDPTDRAVMYRLLIEGLACGAKKDRISELALVAIKAAKPLELAPTSLIEETEKNGAAMSQRLGEYTYALRKVRRTFDKKGRLRAEEFKDYEAYPVKGQHALVQMSTNGSNHSPILKKGLYQAAALSA